MVQSIKQCTKCKSNKNIDKFGKCKARKDGLNSRCKQCYNDRYISLRDDILRRARQLYPLKKEKKKLYDRQRRDKLKMAGVEQFTENKRSEHYKSRYGITIVQYNQMFLSQNGRCAICDISQSEISKRLAVDHCHVTGNVRKLLCDGCNKGLGHFKDNPELLQKAISYLNILK